MTVFAATAIITVAAILALTFDRMDQRNHKRELREMMYENEFGLDEREEKLDERKRKLNQKQINLDRRESQLDEREREMHRKRL